MPNKRKQRGGASSDFVHSFYANTAVGGPAAMTRAGLQVIDQAPMFNPLSDNTVFPTDSTGIVASGLYLANTPDASAGALPFGGQMGGAPVLNKTALSKLSVAKLRTLCNRLGMSCAGKNGEFLPKVVLVAKILSSNAQQLGGGCGMRR